MPFPRASQALTRFTVLDLTRVRSGPTCVRQLADWGANVIKIDALMEDAAGEQPGGPRRGSDFQNLHRNKRAMTRIRLGGRHHPPCAITRLTIIVCKLRS